MGWTWGGVSGIQAAQKGRRQRPLHSLNVAVFHAITGGPGWLAARPSRSRLGRGKPDHSPPQMVVFAKLDHSQKGREFYQRSPTVLGKPFFQAQF